MKAIPPCIEPLEARIAPAVANIFDLASVDGHNGFKFTGHLSYHVVYSDAGDVNGDGFADIIVGDSDAGGPQYASRESGAAYVVFGKAGGFKADFDLSKLDGKNGFKISGGGGYSHVGFSVSSAGDINGDGFANLLIGAPGRYSEYYGSTPNAAYVIFGKATGFAANLKLSTLNGSNGFKIAEPYSASGIGFAVKGAGDVNGDGFDDLVISNGLYGNFVIFGKSGQFAPQFELEALNGHNGFHVYGAQISAISGAGDVNGDGFDDLIFGSPRADPHGSYSGAAYVVFGHSGGFAASLNLSGLNGTNGFQISGAQTNDRLGNSVSGAGDVNGDGFADLIISAPGVNHPYGASYVVLGKAGGFAANLDVSTLDGSNGFALSGDNAGIFSVSGAGDVNGDGFADLIIGATQVLADSYSTASYVVYGKAANFVPKFDLASINGLNGFKIFSVPGDYSSSAIEGSRAGDINGDGFADILVGGGRYVVFGSEMNGLAPNGKTAHLLDSDGDLLTISTSKGRLHPSEFNFGADGGLESIDLRGHAAEFAGANLTMMAQTPPDGTGDGALDLGQLRADGIDLGTVKIDGHLGLIHAGDADIRTPGVQALVVEGLGGPGGLHSAITGALGALIVRGDVLGADVSILGGTKARLGQLEVLGDVGDGSVFDIGGNLGPAHIGRDLGGGGIHVGGRMASLTVDGDVQGDSPAVPLIISALGQRGATTESAAMAIGALTIGGNVANTQVLAGYSIGGDALNGDAGIGTIFIHGSFAASDIVAGIADSTDDGFGQHDTPIPGGQKTIVATISSLTIRGTATGSVASDDFFGITAEAIDAASIHGIALALTTGKDNRLLDTTNRDLRIIEV